MVGGSRGFGFGAVEPTWTTGPAVPGLDRLQYVVRFDTKDDRRALVTTLMSCHGDHVFAVLPNRRMALSSRELDCLKRAGFRLTDRGENQVPAD